MLYASGLVLYTELFTLSNIMLQAIRNVKNMSSEFYDFSNIYDNLIIDNRYKAIES